MEYEDRLDEESKALLETIPEKALDLSDIPKLRETLDVLVDAMFADAADVPGVDVENHWAPGPPGEPDVMVRVYTPSDLKAPAPGFYWMHGGGMVIGYASMEDPAHKATAAEMGCVVASVEYRLAPEHPHPAPIEDCYAGLKWFADNAESLGVDRDRIAIGGGSAGGGLAAALALLARDRGEIDIISQQLIYPMLDDRSITHASHYVQHPKVWNRKCNLAGWGALLGESRGSDDVSLYASPARAQDLSGLPPAFIIVGELDLFVDEDVDYAMRLIQAGVPTELHVFPGAFHGSELMLPNAETSRRWKAVQSEALRQALHG
ncbi:MAG: alpha/beta hydrolase [Actinomycetia bacterium]|nr:alpha/beta hydrolase [Actinomycetes bacterium]